MRKKFSLLLVAVLLGMMILPPITEAKWRYWSHYHPHRSFGYYYSYWPYHYHPYYHSHYYYNRNWLIPGMAFLFLSLLATSSQQSQPALSYVPSSPSPTSQRSYVPKEDPLKGYLKNSSRYWVYVWIGEKKIELRPGQIREMWMNDFGTYELTAQALEKTNKGWAGAGGCNKVVEISPRFSGWYMEFSNYDFF